MADSPITITDVSEASHCAKPASLAPTPVKISPPGDALTPTPATVASSDALAPTPFDASPGDLPQASKQNTLSPRTSLKSIHVPGATDDADMVDDGDKLSVNEPDDAPLPIQPRSPAPKAQLRSPAARVRSPPGGDPRRKLSVFGVDGAMDGARFSGQQRPPKGTPLIPIDSECPLSPSISESDSYDTPRAQSFSAVHPIKHHDGIVNVTFPTTPATDASTPFRCYAMSSRVGASVRGDKVNQDRPYSCVPFNNDPRSAVFAVFDGHGFAGDSVAQYLTEHIEECLLGKKLSDSGKTSKFFTPADPAPPTDNASNKHRTHTQTIAKTDSPPQKDSRSPGSSSRQRSSSCPGDPERHSSGSDRSNRSEPRGSGTFGRRRRNSICITPSTNRSVEVASDRRGDDGARGSPVVDLDDQNEVRGVFTEGFEKLEKNLISGEAFDTHYSGSTCICLLMHEGVLYSINVGDSRAVLGRSKWYTKKSLKAIALSRDHSPGIRAERKRIQSKNGRVHSTITPSGIPCGPLRVWLPTQAVPGLAMSRSFGDELAHSVGVIAVPEIKRFDIKPNKDKLIVLGSDGLFEFMSNKEIVNIAYKYDDPSKACEHLCNIARSRWIEEEDVIDDITAIVIYLK